MKNLLLLVLQIVGMVCAIGFILSVIGIFLGRPLHFKGAEAPNDWRAAVTFLIAAAVIGGIFYLLGKRRKS
jgi:putative exporter of polyketide antibiotics